MVLSPRAQQLQLHLDDLPIFPLGEAVLFPRAALPLHIFEQRYRAMVRDARSGGLPIAVAMLDNDGRTDDLGRPRVRPVAGAGFIESLEELPDGRFLIELVGVARVRIVREHPQATLYRKVQAELLHDRDHDEALARERTQTLRLVLQALQSTHPRAAGALVDLVSETEESGVVADLLASAVVANASRRQQLLEELDPVRRIEAITHHLGEVLARLNQAQDQRRMN